MAEMASSAALSSRLSRSANACQRCRRRKQKCDLRYPRCSSCENAGVDCLSYHAGKQAEVPRNYISSLEGQVEKLKKELEEVRNSFAQEAVPPPDIHRDSPETAVGGDVPRRMSNISGSEGGGASEQELVKSMGLVVLEPSNQPRFLGTSSGITLAKIVMASIQCEITPTSASPEAGLAQPSQAHGKPSSLPPRRAAKQIIDAYFEQRTPHSPVLDRAEVAAAVDHSYLVASGAPMFHNGDGAEKSTFVTFMVFAVGLCGMLSLSGERPAESEGCFNSALQHLDAVLTYSRSDLDTISNILLLCQYISLTPSRGSLWQLTGIALRAAQDIGLHWETDAILHLNPALLNRRRRLFWAIYGYDRLLCITLGRPFGVVDPSTSVGFPSGYQSKGTVSAWDRQSQGAANHVSMLQKLESETKQVLYHLLRENSIAYPRPNYALWMSSIQPRLQEWRSLVPATSGMPPQSIYACEAWWDALYNDALLLLYRPNPLVPQPTQESLRICCDASTKLIYSVRLLQREHRIHTPWVWTHRLFVAGLTLMFALWSSEEVRNSYPVDEIIETMQCGSSTLSAISERFPGASSSRDAFETLASVTTKRLLSPQQPIAPGPPIETLQQTFPTMDWTHCLQADNSMEDVFGMLSHDTFGFGDILNSTAQWPPIDGTYTNNVYWQNQF